MAIDLAFIEIRYPENKRGVTIFDPHFTARDPDGGDLTWSLMGHPVEVPPFSVTQSDDGLEGFLWVVHPLDHETKSRYDITIKVSDGKGGEDSLSVTIQVDDVNEPPGRPATPAVIGASDPAIVAAWKAPLSLYSGVKPPVTSYDLRYCKRGDDCSYPDGAGWVLQQGAGTITAETPAAIFGVPELDATYDVQVRAINAEGIGGWSPRGKALTIAVCNQSTWCTELVPGQRGESARVSARPVYRNRRHVRTLGPDFLPFRSRWSRRRPENDLLGHFVHGERDPSHFGIRPLRRQPGVLVSSNWRSRLPLRRHRRMVGRGQKRPRRAVEKASLHGNLASGR